MDLKRIKLAGPTTVVALALVAHASAAAGGAGPIDGTYRQQVTAAEILAAGGDQGEAAISANTGSLRWVFTKGRFVFTQEDGSECTWEYGRFTVAGHRLTITFANGGGVNTNAYNRPGERFAFVWSLYRGALTLGAAKGAISPAPSIAAPLRLVSKRPLWSTLSKRCEPPAVAIPKG